MRTIEPEEVSNNHHTPPNHATVMNFGEDKSIHCEIIQSNLLHASVTKWASLHESTVIEKTEMAKFFVGGARYTVHGDTFEHRDRSITQHTASETIMVGEFSLIVSDGESPHSGQTSGTGDPYHMLGWRGGKTTHCLDEKMLIYF